MNALRRTQPRHDIARMSLAWPGSQHSWHCDRGRSRALQWGPRHIDVSRGSRRHDRSKPLPKGAIDEPVVSGVVFTPAQAQQAAKVTGSARLSRNLIPSNALAWRDMLRR
jgi:hypothetical protein